jgi:hypothetical protein
MKGANIVYRSYLFAKLHCLDHNNTKAVGENRYQLSNPRTHEIINNLFHFVKYYSGKRVPLDHFFEWNYSLCSNCHFKD